MSTSRRPAAVTGLALGLAALALAVSGCTLTSPKIITTPYAASDGSNADVGDVKLRNFLLVSEGGGKPGVVIGAVSTDGTEPVQLRLTVLDAAGENPLGQADVTARPGQLTQVGGATGSTPLQVENVPVAAGSVLTVRVQTPAGGTDFTLPVVPPLNEYATIKPSTRPTSSPSSTASPTGSSSATGTSSSTTRSSGSSSTTAASSSSS